MKVQPASPATGARAGIGRGGAPLGEVGGGQRRAALAGMEPTGERLGLEGANSARNSGIRFCARSRPVSCSTHPHGGAGQRQRGTQFGLGLRRAAEIG